MKRCQGQHDLLGQEGQEEDGLSMELDPGGVPAAGLEGGSGTDQVEKWAQSGSCLGGLMLETPSALQTQHDSPFRQKDGSVCEGFLINHMTEMSTRQRHWTCGIMLKMCLDTFKKTTLKQVLYLRLLWAKVKACTLWKLPWWCLEALGREGAQGCGIYGTIECLPKGKKDGGQHETYCFTV